jgi:nucleoid DNA-binding protein
MENLTTEETEKKGRTTELYQTHLIKELDKKLDSIAKYVVNDLTDVVNLLNKEVQTLKDQKQIPASDNGIFKVKSIFFNKEYEYMGKTFNRYVIELEGFPSPFIMDRKAKNAVNPEVGGNIFCKIDGDKLKDVEVIHTLDN